MSALETLVRFSIRLAQHPVTQSLLRHAIREGTAELVRQVQRRTRADRQGDIKIH